MTDGVQGDWNTVESKHTRTYLFELNKETDYRKSNCVFFK